MHKIPPAAHPLAAELVAVLMPILKNSQSGMATAMAGVDLTFSQMRMLFVLDNADADMAVNELAESVALSLPAAGRAVDGMVRQGLVTRREDEADRRVKRIALADSGRETLELVGRARVQSADRFVAALTAEDRDALAGALATLGELTRKHYGAPNGTSCFPQEKK